MQKVYICAYMQNIKNNKMKNAKGGIIKIEIEKESKGKEKEETCKSCGKKGCKMKCGGKAKMAKGGKTTKMKMGGKSKK